MNKLEAEAAETITKAEAAEIKEGQNSLLFISVLYELTELREQDHLRAIDTRDKFVIILIPTFLSLAVNW